MVSAKQAYFHAVAQHRQGLVAQASKNFGETVARTKVSWLLIFEITMRVWGRLIESQILAVIRECENEEVPTIRK